MVNISPLYDDVSWPADEGVLGVVGVAPWATLDFCQQLYGLVQADKEWQYPRLIIDNNSKIPSRGRHLQLGERDPSPWIHATITELAAAGATVAVVPCNTAHLLWSRWSKDAAIPVINIIDATLEHIAPQGKRVVVLGSQMLYQSRLYHDALTQQHAEIVNVAASTQQLVTRCINEIKATKSVSELSMRQLADAVNSWKHQGATHIILACTELSLLKHSAIWQEMTLIDSSEALARAALRAISFRRLRN